MNMDKKIKLNKRQLTVIEDLFNGNLDEQTVLDKHKVSRNLYNKWLTDDAFVGEFDRRIESAYRQSAALIARYAPLAAAKLVQLTESDKEETARKACLDIISMPLFSRAKKTPAKGEPEPAEGSSDPVQGFALPAETASKLLSILAEESTEKET
jgi:hypothetical protein